MDETIVVRRDLHMVELAHRCEPATLGDPSKSCNRIAGSARLLLEERAAAIARGLALAAGERDAGALRQEPQLAAIINPAHRPRRGGVTLRALVLSAPRLKAYLVDSRGLAFGDNALVNPAPRKAVD
jgi:hypothetical protein